MAKTLTVVEYVIRRLAELGIDRAFGVPGDYSFPIDDAIEASDKLSWVLCSNELNASYAADGYARRRGAAILTTTYAVGELSAVNGVMGAKAHRVPIFHIVGAPSTRIQRRRQVTHHTLGDGTYNNFFELSAATACVSAHITPDNVVSELERLIHEAFRLSQPAYMLIPEDFAKMPIRGTPIKGTRLTSISRGRSNPVELRGAVQAIVGRMKKARRTLILPTFHVGRYNAKADLLSFLKRTRLPFSLTQMDKGLLDESHPQYIGVYAGKSSFPVSVASTVENSDLLLNIGGIIREDLNTGLWTDRLEKVSTITIGPDYVETGNQTFTCVQMHDVLRALARVAPRAKSVRSSQPKLLPMSGSDHDPIGSDSFYPRLQRFLRPGDTLVAETGTCTLHLGKIWLPENVGYESQLLWGSIGWATPTALGVALAEPKRRTILVTGDGSHQLTATEIGVMGRYGVNPIIILLNNGLYGIEDVLSQTGHVYDSLAGWDYHTLPAAMGCRDWFCTRVETVAELESALETARNHSGASYLELMIPPEESQPLPKKTINRIYKTYAR
ncbi:MAG: alpha-keto acid decarboxylase family protein [Verrucomicrobia bacterium]|nr:alpha-keto acid decarboxylase family protein [Verrucomicrobiota bacterium]